jgi:hypothetical protein
MAVNRGAAMDEATARLLGLIRDALKDCPGREVAAVRTACLVGMTQEDGREASIWLESYLNVGTGASAKGEEKHPGNVGASVPAQLAAS